MLPAPPTEPVGELVLLTRHGFTNRLRSVAAAYWLAAEVGRCLHVAWQSDASCEAKLEDLVVVAGEWDRTPVHFNSLTALSAAVCFTSGAAGPRGHALSCYEPYGNRCVLYACEVAPLRGDTAAVALLSGAALPATLRNRQLAALAPTAGTRGPAAGTSTRRRSA